jgi:hypothetical protein
MGDLVTDPEDPRLGHGVDPDPVPQNDAYLVLSDVELAKGFIRPVRRTYVHWTLEDGSPAPTVVVDARDLQGCGAATTMSQIIAETYARDPKFYGSTYCVGCRRHLPVTEFTWSGTEELVGS